MCTPASLRYRTRNLYPGALLRAHHSGGLQIEVSGKAFHQKERNLFQEPLLGPETMFSETSLLQKPLGWKLRFPGFVRGRHPSSKNILWGRISGERSFPGFAVSTKLRFLGYVSFARGKQASSRENHATNVCPKTHVSEKHASCCAKTNVSGKRQFLPMQQTFPKVLSYFEVRDIRFRQRFLPCPGTFLQQEVTNFERKAQHLENERFQRILVSASAKRFPENLSDCECNKPRTSICTWATPRHGTQLERSRPDCVKLSVEARTTC